MMDTMIYLWDFRLCFEPLKNYRSLKKILIVGEDYKERGEISLGIFDEIYKVKNIYNFEEVDTVVGGILENQNVTAIIASFEGVVELAGQLRTKYNIPGIGCDLSKAVRNKSLMKQIISSKGIKTARTQVVDNISQLKNLIKFDYPVVLKPLSSWGTKDTYKISNEEELNFYIENSILSNQPVLVEEFITGREFHCDSIVVDNKVVFSSVGEYLFNCLDSVVNSKPRASIVYPKQDDLIDYIQNIKKLNADVISALGINNSVCHAEMFLKPNGEVYFSEIGTRLGGGQVLIPCVTNSHGINLYQEFIDVELHNYSPKVLKDSGLYTGFIMFPSYKGVVKSISCAEEFECIPGLLDLNISYKVGQKVLDANNTINRAGFAIVENQNFESLKENLINMYNMFKLEVE